MKRVIILLLLFLIPAWLKTFAQDSTKIAELEKRIKVLESKLFESELEKLKSNAESLSNKKQEDKKVKVFKSGQRSLQAINPEISLTGDAYGQFIPRDDYFVSDNRTGAYFRTLGLHFQSNLDPFSFTKAAVEFTPEGVELGEAYITWANALPSLSITAGKFRQQFGVLNRWHVHALDQFDFPLALTTILGEEGLNQIGVSFDWLMPSLTADANSLTLQITNGQNEHLFSGELFSFPSILAHFKNYYDLSTNTYFEFGLTGMYGKNNIVGMVNNVRVDEPSRKTILGGLDLSLVWEPVNRAHYKSLTWRTEFYYANKELINNQSIEAWGGYSYLNYKLSELFDIGTRVDYTQPFETGNNDKHIYQIAPYITWYQSHWVKLRLQYNYLSDTSFGQDRNMLRLQFVWGAGPHKHDRY